MIEIFRVAVLLTAVAVVAAHPDETNLTLTVDGVTYSNVTFGTVTPSSVSIFHSCGVARVPLAKLPSDLQKRFGYDSQKAGEWQIREQQAAAATEVTLRAQQAAQQAATRAALEQQAAQIAANKAKREEEQEAKKSTQPAYSSADILGAKPYTITELNKYYNNIEPDTLIIVRFERVSGFKSYAKGVYWVNLRDANGNALPAIVGNDGVRYFAPSENRLRERSGSVYCTVSEEDLTNKMGANLAGPVIHVIGSTIYRPLGGPVTISW